MRLASSLTLRRELRLGSPGLRACPKGPSTQIVGFQGPKAIQSMDFGT